MIEMERKKSTQGINEVGWFFEKINKIHILLWKLKL